MDEPLVRVVVYLEAAALEDLEVLVRYRHGGSSRSEVVRTAIGWLRAKEAGWLVRAKRVEQLRARKAADEAQALALARAERDRLQVEQLVGQALDVARGRGD